MEMPATTASRLGTRRDSWPPTQVHLHPSLEHRGSSAMDSGSGHPVLIDDDPLTYFLTPAPLLDEDEDGDIAMMDFDAGIEDSKRPAQVVRSVSPSSLDGLSRSPPSAAWAIPRAVARPRSPPSRLSSPDNDTDFSSVLTSDEEDAASSYGTDDNEKFIRFPGNTVPADGHAMHPGGVFSLHDFASLKARRNARKAAAAAASADAILSSPPSFSTATSRGRRLSGHTPLVPRHSAGEPTGGRPNGGSGNQRSRTPPSSLAAAWGGSPRLGPSRPHSWREPSPDVWSIDEEAETDVAVGDAGGSGVSGPTAELSHAEEGNAINSPPAKPKKKVRFVLPAEEIN